MRPVCARAYSQLLARILLLVLCCFGASALHAAAAPEARIDRSVVSEGDSLTLTIRIDDAGSDDDPDFSVLERDFQLYGTTRSSQHMITNGRARAWTEWRTTLLPKRSGQLVIPPIAVGSMQTQALTLQVNPAEQTTAQDGAEEVFLEAQLEQDSVYVQQQALLTLRVFHAIELDDMRLSEPEFSNAGVHKLGESSFRRQINGVTYLVHELKYAIFPQQAGTLTIPEMVFNASQPTRSRSLFDFPGQGRPLRKMTRQLQLHVKPIPPQFTGSVWLPARNLTVVESWGGNPQQVAVGESITRSLTIRADGLRAAQLPALDLPKIDNAKLYGDQPNLEDQDDSSGVHGKRVESAAMIATQAGPVTLPEVRIVWWDVESDSEKVATIPQQTLTIKAGAPGTTSTAPPLPQQETQTEPRSGAPGSLAMAAATVQGTAWWPAVSAALALLWLITLLLYWRLRRRLGTQSAPVVSDSARANEDRAFRDFSAACRADNAEAARSALLRWAQSFYADAQLNTLDQLARRADDAGFSAQLSLLDHSLFSARRTEWHGATLLAAAKEIRRRGPGTAPAVVSQLPPLYPV